MATSTVNMTGNPDIDGVLSGVRWAGNLMTYGFPTSGAQYGAYSHTVGGLTVDETNGFSALSAMQQAAAQAAFTELARYTLMAPLQATPASNADVRMAMSSTREVGSTTAYARYPGDGLADGDAWFNPTDYNAPTFGSFAYATFFHEIGHTLGLKHGHAPDIGGNTTVLPSDHDSLEYSTMTYRAYVGHPGAGGYGVPFGNYPQTYMMLDIAALQTMYGADYSTNAGNNVYRFDANTGQMFLDGVGQGIAKLADGSDANVLFRTVWDGNGTDTYDFSGYSTALDIDLAPGGYVDVNSSGNTQAADLGQDAAGTEHFARGQLYNAMLINGDTRSLIENAIGGINNDSIRGNQADNWLRGGAGNDVLQGFDGNDTLDQGDMYADGLFGLGAMYGGNGNDTMWAGPGAEIIDGGNGVDLVNYSRSDARVVIDTTAGKVTEGYAAGDTLVGIEQIIGTAFNDYIVMGDGNNFISGGDGNDRLAGGAGADALYGSNGNDELTGGTGADLIDGGAGTDTAAFEGAVVINLATGVHGGEAAGDSFFNIEQYRGGVGNDTMTANPGQAARFIGGDGADTLIGGNGDDWLQGGKGVDRLVGGAGFDMVSYADAPGRIVADLSQRDDQSQGKIAAGEWGYDALTSIEDVEGTAFNDKLLGDEGSNKLVGLDGDDYIDGRAGIDFLQGGAGNDTIIAGDSDFDDGGSGYDTLSFDAAAYVNVGTQTFRIGGQGFNATGFESYVGSAVADFFSGAAFGETFNSGAGNDEVRANGGDDTIYIGAGADILDGGAGYDTIVFSRATIADWQAGILDADIASDTWLAWEAIQGSAGDDRIRTNSWGYNIELRGGAGNDVLACGNGSDVLYGEDGDDTLSGGAGGDTLIGGAGNDTLRDTALNLDGDLIADFAIGDLIDVSALRFSGIRYDTSNGTLELDTAADGSYATRLYLPTGLQGEFVAIESAAGLDASTAVRLMLDSDGDGVGDFHDNAIDVPNPDQRDTDGDGYGNVIDADLNQDLIIDLFDLSLLEAVFGSNDANADFNGDGSVDLFDLSVLDALFGGPPGRSWVDGSVAPPTAAPISAGSAEALADSLSRTALTGLSEWQGATESHLQHPIFRGSEMNHLMLV